MDLRENLVEDGIGEKIVEGIAAKDYPDKGCGMRFSIGAEKTT